jgi:hypothetical protein
VSGDPLAAQADTLAELLAANLALDRAAGMRALLGRQAAHAAAQAQAADDASVTVHALARVALLAGRLATEPGSLSNADACALIVAALAGPDVPLVPGCWQADPQPEGAPS